MAAEDYIPCDVFMREDDDHYFHDYYAPHERELKTCDHCGTGGFVWGQNHNGAWRLFDAWGSMHECRHATASDDDFEDLTGEQHGKS